MICDKTYIFTQFKGPLSSLLTTAKDHSHLLLLQAVFYVYKDVTFICIII
jgi:hypothetical protein